MPLCYLVGAMSCYKNTPEYEEKAVLWRRKATNVLANHVVTFDPTTVQTLGMDWNDQCFVELNFNNLQRASFIIASAENIEKSPGSIVELTYAYLNYIPVLWFGELTTQHPHIKRILGMNGYKTLDEALTAARVIYGIDCGDDSYPDTYSAFDERYYEAMEEWSREAEEQELERVSKLH